MQVGLFIPIYIDHFYPQVGMATDELVEQFGCEIEFPDRQLCCGQPMENTGCTNDTRQVAEKFFQFFGSTNTSFALLVLASRWCEIITRNILPDATVLRSLKRRLLSSASTMSLATVKSWIWLLHIGAIQKSRYRSVAGHWCSWMPYHAALYP